MFSVQLLVLFDNLELHQQIFQKLMQNIYLQEQQEVYSKLELHESLHMVEYILFFALLGQLVRWDK